MVLQMTQVSFKVATARLAEDTIDHPHIKGVTIKGVEPLYEAMRKGTDKDWEERAGCMTFPDAVAKALKAKDRTQPSGSRMLARCPWTKCAKLPQAWAATSTLTGTLLARWKATSESRAPLSSALSVPLLSPHMRTASGWRLASQFWLRRLSLPRRFVLQCHTRCLRTT